jgi:hypothetical protein
MKNRLIPFIFLSLFLLHCTKDNEKLVSSSFKLFSPVNPSVSGIDFQNAIQEGLNTNVLMYEYFYNGGGVAVGDVGSDKEKTLTMRRVKKCARSSVLNAMWSIISKERRKNISHSRGTKDSLRIRWKRTMTPLAMWISSIN